MDYTVRMKNGPLLLFENVFGITSTSDGEIVFFSEVNDKMKCTIIKCRMKDLVIYREDCYLRLDNIDRIHPYNVFKTDKETSCSHVECSALETINKIRTSIDEIRRLLND